MLSFSRPLVLSYLLLCVKFWGCSRKNDKRDLLSWRLQSRREAKLWTVNFKSESCNNKENVSGEGDSSGIPPSLEAGNMLPRGRDPASGTWRVSRKWLGASLLLASLTGSLSFYGGLMIANVTRGQTELGREIQLTQKCKINPKSPRTFILLHIELEEQ